MANQVGAAIGRAFDGALKGAVTGGIGSFFAPVSAAAAGGAWSVIGASAIASCAVGVVATPLITLTFQKANEAASDPNSPPGLAGALCTLGLLETGVAIYLGCQLGAAALGVAAAPVLSCYLTGIVACAVLSLVFAAIVAIAAVVAAVALDETTNHANGPGF